MSHFFENGILVHCNECMTNILRNVNEKIPFEIKNFKGNEQESRKESLEFIISTLYKQCDYKKSYESRRNTVMRFLLSHGQFKKEEIDTVFEENSYESEDYSDEFYEKLSAKDRREISKRTFSDEPQLIKEVKYKFASSFCDYKEFIGFCVMDIENCKCPDCGKDVTNTPDNVEWNTKDLICPFCFDIQNVFGTKGLVRINGTPMHHGSWSSQRPEFEYSGTDYFFILHKNCPKSRRSDGKGVMVVNGLWADSLEDTQHRIVLGLECLDCGAKNALKPFLLNKFTERNVPLLDINVPRILNIIFNGENEKVEFKPFLTEPPEGYTNNDNQKFKIARAVSSFMNSDGGAVLIGVSDSGDILGLDNEYLSGCKDKVSEELGKNLISRDKFLRKIYQILEEYIDKILLKESMKVSFHDLYGKDICCLRVKKSNKPCYLSNGQHFFIRSSARTLNLKKDEREQYIKYHWILDE
jgi:hypothetical protein